jgi:hypothetical protein
MMGGEEPGRETFTSTKSLVTVQCVGCREAKGDKPAPVVACRDWEQATKGHFPQHHAHRAAVPRLPGEGTIALPSWG